jgi:transcriptional regulator
MRPNPKFEATDAAVVKRLIAENPWGTIVSDNGDELVASHYPILLDDRASDDELTVVTHVGRPDEKVHRLGDSEVLLIVAGPHGYISPSWYSEEARRVPTWNFSVAHCHGVPEILDPDENLRVLTRLVAHFEQHAEEPAYLDQELGARVAPGTVGLRIPITRFVCKVKMSQDKDPESQRNVLEALRRPGAYEQPRLADEMARALEADSSPRPSIDSGE